MPKSEGEAPLPLKEDKFVSTSDKGVTLEGIGALNRAATVVMRTLFYTKRMT